LKPWPARPQRSGSARRRTSWPMQGDAMNDDSYTDRSTGLHDKVIQVHSTRACIAPLPGPAVQR